MPKINHEQLMAYADGELSVAEAALVTEAIAQDPTLDAQVARFAASRKAMKQAFALPPAAAPLSPKLAQLLAAPAQASAIHLAPRRRAGWPLALAASLLLGLGLLIGTHLVATPADALSLALETLPSGTLQRTADGEIAALSTIVAADGSICREYERSTTSDTRRGLACRESASRWRERSLVATVATVAATPPTTTYRLASGARIDAAQALKGRRLTVEEERQRLEQRWR